MSGGTHTPPGPDMPSQECPDLRPRLGAYVLGALGPDEAGVVEAHLHDCPACQEERDALAGVLPFLAQVGPEDAARPPSPPGEVLLRRVLDRVAEERRRARRRRLAVAASAAALVLLLGGGTWALVGTEAGPPGAGRVNQAPSVASGAVLARTDPDTRVRARLAVEPVQWGTKLSLSLTGIPEDARCRLVAVARDGRREVAASWHATYHGTANVDGGVALDPEQVQRFEVVTFEGAQLVALGWQDRNGRA